MNHFNNWYNLFDESNDLELLDIPGEFWYLQVIEISIQLGNDHFLVLEYPFYSYSDIVHNKIKECIWSPPYIATKMDLGSKKIRKVGQIKSEYRHFEEEKKQLLHEILDYKLYTMGIGNYNLTENGDILEYKKSFREPSKWKCYYIKRIGLTDLDSFSLYNIIDPECLKGYSYLNITRNNELLIKSPDNSAFFKGKPLASNTMYLFLSHKINTLLTNTNKITKDYLTYHERGILLSFDLISFGKNQEIVNDTYKTFDSSGSEIANEFEFLLNNIFGTALFAHNYNQFRLMGDGFIAASPLRHNIEFDNLTDDEIIDKQIINTIKMIQYIFDQIKQKAYNLPQQFSCRCSMLFDNYYYGKIGGLICDKADISGRSILKCERLQGVINTWFSESKAHKSNHLYMAIDKVFFDKHKSRLDSDIFDDILEYSGSYKEFQSNIIILVKEL